MSFDRIPTTENFPNEYRIIFFDGRKDIAVTRDDLVTQVGAKLENDKSFKDVSDEIKENRAFFAIDDYLQQISGEKYPQIKGCLNRNAMMREDAKHIVELSG